MAKRTWLTDRLVKLSWVSLLQDAASEMLYPIIPVLLNAVFGAPALVVGLIESLAEGVAALTKLLSNQINRFLSKRSMVIGGYGLAAVGKVVIALASAWPMVLLGRVVDRLGKGMRSASRDAILLEDVEPSDRGKVVGFHRTADNFGALIGPAIALLLLSVFENKLGFVLWIAVIPAVLSSLVTFSIRGGNSKASKVQTLDKVPLGGKANQLILVVALFSLVNFPDALILLHLTQSGWSLAAVISVYLLFNLSSTLFSFPAGLLSDRFAPKLVFAFGLFCFAFTYFGLAATSNQVVEGLLMVVYGLFAAINETVGKSWVSKLAGSKAQLQAQSRLQGWSGFAILGAGIWAGFAWGDTGVVPLAVSGVLAVMVALFLALRKF